MANCGSCDLLLTIDKDANIAYISEENGDVTDVPLNTVINVLQPD